MTQNGTRAEGRGSRWRRRRDPKRLRPGDVAAIRRRVGGTQVKFARMIGVSLATLRNWEQGRREPGGAARALLRVAEHDPAAVTRALGSERERGT